MIVKILTEVNQEIGKKVAELLKKTEDLKKLEKQNQYNVRILSSIVEFISSEDERFAERKKLQEESAEFLKNELSVEIFGNTEVEEILNAMDSLGLLLWLKNENKITFFTSPTMFYYYLRKIPLMEEKALSHQMAEVLAIREKKLDDSAIKKEVENRILNVMMFVEKLKRCLTVIAIRKLGLNIEHLDSYNKVVSVELLPTSTDFYNAGTQYYKMRNYNILKKYYTFSTTSGLIMPEEHFGSDYFKEIDVENIAVFSKSIEKNPYRKSYFDVVKQSKRQLVYYFEEERTAATFRKTYNVLKNVDDRAAKKYVDDSICILKEYLAQPNFKIIKVPKFPDLFNCLTIGNSNSIILSTRGDDKKIAHGLWIKPKKESGLKKEMREIVANIGFGSILAIPNISETESLPISFFNVFASAFAIPLIIELKKIRDEEKIFTLISDIKSRLEDTNMLSEPISKNSAEKTIYDLLNISK